MDTTLLPELMGILESQNELFGSYFARYRSLHETRRASLSAATAASGDADAHGGGVSGAAAPGALQGMLSSVARLTGGGRDALPQQHQRRCLEDTGDPRLLKLALIPSLAVERWDGSGGLAYQAKLPGFDWDPRVGSNCVVLRAEVYALPDYARQYAAVNIAGDASPSAPILCQACFRVDPNKAPGGGAGGGGGGVRRQYVQGYKLGFWDTRSRPFRSEAECPLQTGRVFWWRIVAHPLGFATYVDGVLVSVSQHAPGQAAPGGPLAPGRDLVLTLPTAGEAGERATWRVTGLWWGSAEVDAAATRELSGAATAGREIVRDALRATGVPPDVTVDELFAAFAPWAPRAVRLEGGGAATVTLASPDDVARALAATNPVVARGARLALAHAVVRGGAV